MKEQSIDELNMVIKVDDVPETEKLIGEKWGAAFKLLTPSNRPRGGRIDIAWIRVRPGRSISPLHYHQREDEIFFLLSGTLTFIYGDEKKTLSAGDCVSCPPGTGIPHQLINESEEDCLYLLILPPDPDEVIVFPESGKVNVRSLNHIGSIDLDKKDSKLSMEETLNLVT